jgi:NADH-quinone oxidoreductase subunit M
MNETTWQQWAITITTFLPIAGAIVVLLVPSSKDKMIRGLGVVTTALAFACSIAIAIGFDYSRSAELQFVKDVSWIPAIGARYHVGIDGISLPLFVLTYLLGLLCAIYTARYVPQPGRTKAFVALTLLLITGMAGTFISFDLILFFVFWELVLVPMYFLIGVWGSANRQYASIKFFLYTLFGSVFMLLGFLALYFTAHDPVTGAHTFDLQTIINFANDPNAGFSHTFQLIVFGAIALGFAVKVPMWPFHTWLPDAHTEAPTIGSVLLAGIMLKMGTYGFIRIALPALPEGAVAYAPWIGALAAIAIVYAALACLAQKDLKRLIAFSSVGHMGFVMLGIATLTTIGIQAAIFGMVAHGVITGMLFFCVGSIYDRYHTREISEIGGGMGELMPKMAGIFAFVAIASLGLPGLAGFIGEFMALLSSFSPAAVLNVGLYRTFMVIGGIGTILTAGYFLWMLQRVNQGEAPVKWRDHHFRDILAVEWVSWVPLLALTLVLGLVPSIILNPTLHGADLVVHYVTG